MPDFCNIQQFPRINLYVKTNVSGVYHLPPNYSPRGSYLHCGGTSLHWNLVFRCIYDIIDHDVRRLDQQQLRAPPAHPNLILIA